MSCDRRRLSAYRDGELEPAERRALDLHMQECADCSAELRSYVRMAHAIRSLPFEAAPRSLRASVYRELDARARKRSPWAAFGAPTRVFAPAALAAVVAITFMGVMRPGAVEAPTRPVATLEAVTASAPPVAVPAPPPAVVTQPKPTVVGNPIVPVQLLPQVTTDPEMPSAISALYRSNADVRRMLGQPLPGSRTVTLVEQSFQGGVAVWRSDTSEIYVLGRGTGPWKSYSGVLKATSAGAADALPPPGALAPSGGFGRLWTAQPEVKTRLGWAVYEPRGFGGMIQTFERGTVLWSPYGILYVLANDGSWKAYFDSDAR
ncbi:MAG: anti-sigma factor [Chloroflexota bacterium]